MQPAHSCIAVLYDSLAGSPSPSPSSSSPSSSPALPLRSVGNGNRLRFNKLPDYFVLRISPPTTNMNDHCALRLGPFRGLPVIKMATPPLCAFFHRDTTSCRFDKNYPFNRPSESNPGLCGTALTTTYRYLCTDPAAYAALLIGDGPRPSHQDPKLSLHKWSTRWIKASSRRVVIGLALTLMPIPFAQTTPPPLMMMQMDMNMLVLSDSP
jgi:hypothetical protein